jgi:RNA-directed DNA polymerase
MLSATAGFNASRQPVSHFALQPSHSPLAELDALREPSLVHCRSRAEAEHLLTAIGERLAQCKLTLHPEKSRVAYCKNSNRRQEYPQVQFTFLGFTFKPRALGPHLLPGRSETGSVGSSEAQAIEGHRQQSAQWLARVARHRPRLFIHWQPLSSRVPITGAV